MQKYGGKYDTISRSMGTWERRRKHFWKELGLKRDLFNVFINKCSRYIFNKSRNCKNRWKNWQKGTFFPPYVEVKSLFQPSLRFTCLVSVTSAMMSTTALRAIFIVFDVWRTAITAFTTDNCEKGPVEMFFPSQGIPRYLLWKEIQ